MTEKIQLCKEISRWRITLLEGLTVLFLFINVLELKFIVKLTHFNPVYSILLANFLIGLDSCDTI